MKIVTDDRVAAFVGAKIDTIIFPPFTAMGIERDGEIISGVVFNCYTGPNIEATVAGCKWGRQFLQELGQYVFGQLGCSRVTITSEHADVLALAKRLGGKVEGTMRDFYGKGRDGSVIGILRDEYRFQK